MTRAIFLLVAIVCGVSCARAETGTPVANARRVAVVVGVGAYQAVPQLPNPPRDARAVAETLKQLGFDTTLVIDPDRAALEQAVRTLGDKSRTAEAAVFFYAGHALEVNGRNYLIPVGARFASARDIPFETVDLDLVGQQVEGRARTVVVFMDACRNNPFATNLSGSERGIRPGGGLAAPAADASGTLIAFATAPGRTAEDGDGADSPFTTALLKRINTPGLEVRSMLGLVRRDVREATDGKQIPWESSALEGEFYFRPGPAAAVAATVPPVAAGPSAAAPVTSVPPLPSRGGKPPPLDIPGPTPGTTPPSRVSTPRASATPALVAPGPASMVSPGTSALRSPDGVPSNVARGPDLPPRLSRCHVSPVSGMRRPGGTATVMNVANDGRGCSFRIYVHAADRVPFEDLVASTVPRNGVVLLANNSQIIYTPRPGFRGEDQFVVSSVPRGTLIVRVIVKPPLPDQPG